MFDSPGELLFNLEIIEKQALVYVL